MGSRHHPESFRAPLPGRRLKRRPRAKIQPLEQFSVGSIAAFKVEPSFLPDHFKAHRPMMGLCCSCLPFSKKDLISDRICEEGIRNIFDVKTEMRPYGTFTHLMPFVSYTMSRRAQGRFPDISMAVLTNKRVVDAIQQTAQDSNTDGKGAQESEKNYAACLSKCEGSAKRILKKMKASISSGLIRFTGWFLLNFLSQFLKSIQVHKGQLEMVQKAAQRGVPIIYMPLHRSHLDYILVTFILWNYNLRAPYVAAGNNLDMPFFNLLMRGLGGFFIRRKLDKGGKKDMIYRSVLHTYMQELLKQGECFEFFIEGGRTRSGKALIPKGGLMSIVADSCMEGVIQDAYVVPISISYEKLLDGNFNREQMGLPKVGESFWGAWKGIWRVLCQNFGSVRVDFAQPFSVKEYIQCNPSQVSRPLSPMASSNDTSPDSSCPNFNNGIRLSSSRGSLQFDGLEASKCLVKGMGHHIVYTAIHAAALTCTQMVAFLFVTKHRQGATLHELVSSFNWLRYELKMRNRDVAFCGDAEVIVEYAAALLGKSLVDRRKLEEDTEMLIPCVTVPDVFELTYYSNTVISPFLMESVVASAVISVGKLSPSLLPCDAESTASVSREQVISVAEELCKLLQEEFIFSPPCVRLTDALGDTVQQFVSLQILEEDQAEFDNVYSTFDRQWANRLSAQLSWGDEDEDELENAFVEEKPLKVRLDQPSTREKLQFYQKVLGPILETYLVTAGQISEKLLTEMPESDFLKHLMSHAQARVANKTATYDESASADTLKNAVKSFQDLRILECYHISNLRMVGLSDHYQVKERLEHYMNILETLLD